MNILVPGNWQSKIQHYVEIANEKQYYIQKETKKKLDATFQNKNYVKGMTSILYFHLTYKSKKTKMCPRTL